MEVEILVSTMNINTIDEFKKQVKQMKISGKSLTINQITKGKNEENANSAFGDNRLISCVDKGLSKSRNQAIKNSIGDILVLADDDIVYEDNYKDIILKAYEKYEDADIIAFVVKNQDKTREKKILNVEKIGYLMSMKLQSVQITFKREAIINNNIKFDENFGAGSDYIMGEENIFLFDCLRKKLKICYVPQNIAYLQKGKSSWFKGYDSKYFKSRGASFYRMSKKMYILFILQFAIRKYKLYKKENNLINAIKEMFNGKKEYLHKNYKLKMEKI